MPHPPLDRIRHRGRVSRVALGGVGPVMPLLLMLLPAMLLPGGAGASAPKKMPLAYYQAHPCSIVTQREVSGAFRAPVDQGLAGQSSHTASCAYLTASSSNNANADLTLRPGTLAGERRIFRGPFTTEAAVGHGAICDANLGVLFADAGSINGRSYYLEIAPGSCPIASQLARDAFARLS